MEEIIKDTLKLLERQHQVKILFACGTGSRASGFPSSDSDYDVHALYVHEPGWYRSSLDKKDTIRFTSEDQELDITGWDIKKYLQLMQESNASVFERLQSPIVYREEHDVRKLLYPYAERCFSPIIAMHYYQDLANNSFADVNGKEEINLKPLFYALRGTFACKWIVEKNDIPPLLFSKMLNELSFADVLKKRIRELMVLKSGKNKNYTHPAERELNLFIVSELGTLRAFAEHLPVRKEKDVDLDEILKQLITFY